MKSKTTGDLSKELMEQASLEDYITENTQYFANADFLRQLRELCQSSKLSKASLARQAGMSEVYFHQIFAGRRIPSRDRLLCLCISLEATLEQTQQILQQATYAQLYPRFKRDAIISHGILHRTDLNVINDQLFAENEKTLF